jgi:ATP-dependent RNA helicase DeaD
MTDDEKRTTPGQVEEQQPAERIVEPDHALPEINLEQLPQKLQEAAARIGWTRLMPVQARAIPYLLARRDLMIQSRTGSGKTGAFILPILERIDLSLNACQALVLAPTRELARQIAKEAEDLSGSGGVRTIAVYGGVGYGPQIDAFRKGAHLVVGTPGRVLDHLLKRSLTLKDLKILIFDEADRMMSMGFYPDMKRVREYLPRKPLSAYMFSATFPPHVLRLAREFLHEPEMLSLSRDHVHVAEVQHVFYAIPAMEKDRCLVRIIEMENPTSALIFCNTKATVNYVTVVLQRFGYDADQLSADLSQSARQHVMERAKAGQLRFLVATDVAARGIDIHDLSHVVLYEQPEETEAYIHRAGRTGRAGAGGEAVSLVTRLELIALQRVADQFGIELIERPAPSDADVAAVVSERVTALLETQLRSRDTLQTERMQRFIRLARELGQENDAGALIAMLLDDYYQQTLHAAPPRPPAEAVESSVPSGRPSPPQEKPRQRNSRRRKRR